MSLPSEKYSLDENKHWREENTSQFEHRARKTKSKHKEGRDTEKLNTADTA